MATFAENITALREENGKKRQEVADALGISRASLEYYDKGKRKVLGKFADYYGVSADYLIGRTNAKTFDAGVRAVCDYTGLSNNAAQMLLYTIKGRLSTEVGILQKCIAGIEENKKVDHIQEVNYLFETQFLFDICTYMRNFADCSYALHYFYSNENMKKLSEEGNEKLQQANKKKKEITKDAKLSLFEASRKTEKMLAYYAKKIIKDGDPNAHNPETQ